MVDFCRRAFRCGVQVLFFVYCLLFLVFGRQIRDLTVIDISDLGKAASKDFLVVFFDKEGVRKSYPKFAKEFAKSSVVLDSFGVELARVDCANTKHPRSECSREKSVFMYRKDDSVAQENFDMSHLFNVDSIVANLLHISLEERFKYISGKGGLKNLISEGKGRENMVFCFIKALGMKEHRYFLESVYHSKGDTLFAMTTDDSIAKEYGLSSATSAALFLFHCKDVTNRKEDCRITQYQGKFEQIPLLRFFQAQTLPKYVVLPSNRTTVYDLLELPINRVFVFSNGTSDLEIEELEQMVMHFQGSVGVILVDVYQHKDMLSSYGLSEDTNFPTAAFVPVKDRDDDLTYVELYPENVAVFTVHNLRNFLKPLVEDSSNEYQRIADGSSLQKLQYAEFSDAIESSADTNYLLASGILLVVFCPEDHESCRAFCKTLRRVVRTFDRVGEGRLTTAYVKTSEHNKAFDGQQFPVIRLHLGKSNDFIPYAGELEYGSVVNFITDSTSLKMPVFLPPSLADEVPVVFSKYSEDSEAFVLKEESEGEDTSSSEDEDDDYLPPEEIEDDEVSAAVLKAKVTIAPSDLVPSLTDKTFDAVRNDNNLLVVDFFQPWDARCKACLQPFVDAAAILGGLDVGSFTIKLARVNCFDWSDVCQRNNITTYPTIKLFCKGIDEIVYNGPLDSNHLTKAVLLLQTSAPVRLASKDDVQMFFDGNLPKLARKATDLSIVGMFADEKCIEFKAYEIAAQSLQSKFFLGYVTGATAKSLSSEYGLRLPSVLAFKRSDPYQSLTVFSDPFTSQHIIDFVYGSSIPSFGELTPFNLPTYLAHQRPLLIVFRSDTEDASVTPVVKKIVRDNSLPFLFLCWMPVYSNKDVNAEILKTYTGSTNALPALVLVDHEKGTFYHYKGEVTKPAVLNWVENIVFGGQEHLSGSLPDREWKPLLEGYDFLEMIDEEEEKKERKRIKKQQFDKAIAKDDQEGEEVHSEPTEPEDKKTNFREKPKTNRPRRPEVKHTIRDEL